MEDSGISAADFDLVHFIGHNDLSVMDRIDLSDYYYQQYESHGGTALDSTTRTKSFDVALVHYGVSFFPFFREWLFRTATPPSIILLAE